MARALLLSLLICAVGAGLEGLFAGKGVKDRLASLRLPAYAPPFAVWVVIGGLYYVICFAVWTRLFLLPRSPALSIAFILLAKLMFINAFWNYLFFRARHLQFAYLIGFPYAAVAIALFAILLNLDQPAAWYFVPYLSYLVYASVWSYRIWKLNSN